MPPAPAASVVVPAADEADYLPATLDSLDAMSADAAHETVVVVPDAGSETAALARERGVAVREQPGSGIADARNAGAAATDGEWLAFVDADTVVRERYLDAMLGFVRAEGLAAASSRCRVGESLRAKPMEWTINHLFPHLSRPVLPGFNLLVDREAFRAVGGFPRVPNEDTAFSRRLARRAATDYHPDVLVETSGRRFATRGLTGATWHYLRLDWRRLTA